MAPECLRRTQLSEVGWQCIPCSRSCDAECCLRTSDWSVAQWSRHGLPFGGWVVRIRQQRTLAGHLLWWMTDECLVDEQAQLKLSPLLDRQPVQVSQSGRHMVAWSEVHDHSSGGVQCPLLRRQYWRWESGKYGVTYYSPGATARAQRRVAPWHHARVVDAETAAGARWFVQQTVHVSISECIAHRSRYLRPCALYTDGNWSPGISDYCQQERKMRSASIAFLTL